MAKPDVRQIWMYAWHLYRWDGSSLTEHRGDILGGVQPSRVFGFAPNDIWNAAGGGDLIEHWDGSKLHTKKLGLGTRPTAIWGCSADDIWMGGRFGTLIHRQP